MTLQKELEHQARSMGARFFGVADLTVAQGAIVAQGGEFLATYPCALSVGVALSDGLVSILEQELGFEVLRPEAPQIVAALGAAIIARENAEKGIQ